MNMELFLPPLICSHYVEHIVSKRAYILTIKLELCTENIDRINSFSTKAITGENK